LTKLKLIEQDIDFIFSKCKQINLIFEGKRIFITGGTGFIGVWFLEYFHKLKKTGIDVEVCVLTRSIQAFKKKSLRRFEEYNFNFIESDIVNFENKQQKFDYIIHAATDASAELNEKNPVAMFSTIVDGTMNLLEQLKYTSLEKVLFLSSGAVYGKQPQDILRISEETKSAPDNLNPVNTYAEAKRAAELLCAIYSKQYNLNFSIARIFSTFGPLLPISNHFAIGNFIKNAITDKKITIKSDGMAIRSNLYIADSIIWLLNILIFGKVSEAYNVGSEYEYSIKELAYMIAKQFNCEVEILGQTEPGWNSGRYVPSTSKIRNQLGVKEFFNLRDSIIKMHRFNSN